MKQLLPAILLFLSFSAHAQMITLFEAGAGAPVGISNGFVSQSFYAEESDAAFFIAGVASDTLKVHIYNQTPGTADFWMTKRIPQMNVYAQLELYADMTLPAGTHFTYSVSADSISWNDLPFAANAPAVFDNSDGNQFLRLSVHVDDFDSVRFSFNYVSVKADTNYFVGLPQLNDDLFSVGTSNGALSIHTETGTEYHVTVYSLNGSPVFETDATGSQQFPLDMENGIYLVGLRGEGNESLKKCYLYR
jgi:hypothetical protein